MTRPGVDRLLERLVENEPESVAPWADLARGQQARRRRLAYRGTAAAATAVTGLTVATSLGMVPVLTVAPAGPPPVSSAGLPTPTSYVSPPRSSSESVLEYEPVLMSSDEVLARCAELGQLMFGDPTVRVSDFARVEGPVFAGDLVDIPLVGTVETAPTCTLVRGEYGEPQVPNFLPDRLTRADDTTAIRRYCSQWLGIDLGSWAVASMADGYGGVAATLVSPGQGYVATCELMPIDLNGWADVAIENHTPLPELHATPLADDRLMGGNYSSCYPPADECTAEGYSAAGVLPQGMESATVVFADGTEIVVPIGAYGTYALRFAAPPGAEPELRTFDIDGVEVGRYRLGVGEDAGPTIVSMSRGAL